jgi:hypothetical protein
VFIVVIRHQPAIFVVVSAHLRPLRATVVSNCLRLRSLPQPSLQPTTNDSTCVSRQQGRDRKHQGQWVPVATPSGLIATRCPRSTCPDVSDTEQVKPIMHLSIRTMKSSIGFSNTKRKCRIRRTSFTSFSSERRYSVHSLASSCGHELQLPKLPTLALHADTSLPTSVMPTSSTIHLPGKTSSNIIAHPAVYTYRNR